MPNSTIFSYRTLAVCALLVQVLAVRSSLLGQVGFGPGVGFEFGVPLDLERGQGSVNGVPALGQGTSFFNALDLAFAVRVGDWPARSWNLSARAFARYGGGEFRSALQQGDREFDPLSQTIVPVLQRYTIATTAAHAGLEGRIGLEIAPGWAFELGPWASYRFASTIDAVRRRVSPLALGAGTADTVVYVEPIETSPWSFGAMPGLTATFDAGLGSPLVAELAARVDARALSEGLGIRSAALVGRITWLLGASSANLDTAPPPLARVDTATAPADTAVREPVPVRSVDTTSVLAASVDLVGIDNGGAVMQAATVTADVIRHEQHYPFLPAAHFDSGSAELPRRYQQLTAGAAAQFSPSDLARSEPAAVYNHTLDILGLRLRQSGEGRLNVAGDVSAGEPAALARARAEAVGTYLQRVWGIDPERLNIEQAPSAGSSDSANGRAVRLTAEPSDLMGPIVIEWLARSYRLPRLDIRPAIRSTAGILRWRIVVRQSDRVVTQYSSDEASGAADVALYVPDDISGALPPLVAELSVLDSLGRSATAIDTLPLTLSHSGDVRSPGADAFDREQFDYLILPETDGILRGLGAIPRRDWLRRIAASLRTGDRVTVRGSDAGSVTATLRSLVGSKGRSIEWSRQLLAPFADSAPTHEARIVSNAGLVVIERSRNP